ncbi:efflux RND transporter periplasmic adaptor subunit [Edaphobacter sp.]|uniref:efflux RND transporter periplasmic adaptor subunit n=1 Tax=Edaphobacter sp. TaxID=1934404 RepID=UPI002DBC36A6|nr:efflux RND transporter periplasmic adaptor subunit [Edaphobacter sp.]HEU5341388.1 efflux RND transporter periplasmic adaptor subunit [Edaphobacter sp.]
MPTTETRRLNPILLWGIFLAVIVLVFITVRVFTRETVEVRVAPVSRENLVASVSTNGKVEPIEEFQAHAPGPGVVAKVYVQVGQKVKAGELLLTLKDADAAARVATANAALSSAEAAMHNMQQGGSQAERLSLASDMDRAKLQQTQASRNLTALEELEKTGAASAGEVAAARERLQSATSSIENLRLRETHSYSPADQARVRAQLNNAKAEVTAAQSAYASNNVRAPFAGTVYSVPVSAYDFVPAGEDLLDLADLNKIQVRAYFDEPEIGKLAVGQAVKIEWAAKPLQVWHGHISIAPTTVITYGTRNVGECLITVDDARGDLLPNTNVTVTVTTSQRFNVLSVPREALHTDGGNFVFRVVNGKLVRTPVVVGVVNLTRVEIVSGLTEKDTVALSTTNNSELTNGLAVKAIE